ncbi:hypothetical protein [Cyprinid herpesvirus 2]|nr:hypothetical protein [Cyprinid herpesvirus 2]
MINERGYLYETPPVCESGTGGPESKLDQVEHHGVSPNLLGQTERVRHIKRVGVEGAHVSKEGTVRTFEFYPVHAVLGRTLGQLARSRHHFAPLANQSVIVDAGVPPIKLWSGGAKVDKVSRLDVGPTLVSHNVFDVSKRAGVHHGPSPESHQYIVVEIDGGTRSGVLDGLYALELLFGLGQYPVLQLVVGVNVILFGHVDTHGGRVLVSQVTDQRRVQDVSQIHALVRRG